VKITFIETQPECIRFLITQGMMHQIKPSPGKPGCNGLFPLSDAFTEFALVDLFHGRYKIAILSETTIEEASGMMINVNRLLNCGKEATVRIGFSEKLTPHTN
jgi:hypothetical protein